MERLALEKLLLKCMLNLFTYVEGYEGYFFFKWTPLKTFTGSGLDISLRKFLQSQKASTLVLCMQKNNFSFVRSLSLKDVIGFVRIFFFLIYIHVARVIDVAVLYGKYTS